MKYDFLIKHGRVLDAGQGIDEIRDVWIYNSKIMPAPEEPDKAEVDEVIDASGLLVLPGLIDFHTHLGYRNSDVGLHPDLYTLPNGVTSAVDAGSGGSCNFESLVHDNIYAAWITMRAFLNITATGIITEQYFENMEPENIDHKRLEYLMERYGDLILGFKCRIGHFFSKELGLIPLDEARKLGEKFHLPVCCHAVWPESPYQDILSRLHQNDILCHCFQSQGEYSILDENGRVQDCVREARDRGVIFDGASGRKNHSLSVMQKAIAQGFLPDIISTDVVTHSIYRKNLFGLPYTMSEYLAGGMELLDVIGATTATPAKLMHLEDQIGTLKPGAMADVAIMQLLEKPMIFHDMVGNDMPADKLFVPVMTWKAGRLAYRRIDYTF
ncbi:MAG: amidohydrolase family protein [Lachnospiraceae bacterium]|nr:amidohydrolase family protein [Lachnospiraceae bacterium]